MMPRKPAYIRLVDPSKYSHFVSYDAASEYLVLARDRRSEPETSLNIRRLDTDNIPGIEDVFLPDLPNQNLRGLVTN